MLVLSSCMRIIKRDRDQGCAEEASIFFWIEQLILCLVGAVKFLEVQ
jgi:hypothetical protein